MSLPQQFDEILKVCQPSVNVSSLVLTPLPQYCNELSMTIEPDTTLAQAEVLFLSFAQLVADIDRRRAEEPSPSTNGVRRRGKNPVTGAGASTISMPTLSDNLRDLLKTGR